MGQEFFITKLIKSKFNVGYETCSVIQYVVYSCMSSGNVHGYLKVKVHKLIKTSQFWLEKCKSEKERSAYVYLYWD